jgi:hypothetical protein
LVSLEQFGIRFFIREWAFSQAFMVLQGLWLLKSILLQDRVYFTEFGMTTFSD